MSMNRRSFFARMGIVIAATLAPQAVFSRIEWPKVTYLELPPTHQDPHGYVGGNVRAASGKQYAALYKTETWTAEERDALRRQVEQRLRRVLVLRGEV